MNFLFNDRLLRAAVSLGFLLGFLGCLVAQQTLRSQPATSEPRLVASEAVFGAGGTTPGFPCCRLASPNKADVVSPRAAFESAYRGDALPLDSMLTGQVEIGLPDDFGVALEDEDSIEVFRLDIQQRTFGVDHAVIRPKVASKATWNTRPNISPPLLV